MAFRIAVSGIRAATADLDATGNNIANANTTGFKSSRAQFSDLFAASSLGSNQNATGQGVQISAISQQFNQGNVAFTDNSLDLAINGQGFFALEDTSGSRLYSRAGAFGVDKTGFVVNATGQRLLAFGANAGVITGAIGTLQVSSANIPPQASTSVQVGINLDAGAIAPTVAFDPANPNSFNNSVSTTVFDSLGQEHLATLFYRKTGANAWASHLRVDGDNAQTNAVQNLTFSNAGALTGGSPAGHGAFTPTTGAAAFTLSVDYTGSTQFGAEFGVNALVQDGFTTGRLSGLDIDENGIVLARFTNGQATAQGQVALANFSNPQGLQALGNSAWAETSGSGAALVGAPGTASLGALQAGAVEESNVDLAEQLVNMIVAQRNFQANAQMIRAEDEVTQTIINIR